VNNELERICKEDDVAQSRHCPGICLDGLKKTTKKPGVPAEFRTEHLSYTSPERFLYTDLLGRNVKR
jgi:hypothetical protein